MALEQSPALAQPPIERQIHVQVERLILEDGVRHAPHEIERLAGEIMAAYASAPIQQYIPNLVYHDVKMMLIGSANYD
jgi:hypothetical protein